MGYIIKIGNAVVHSNKDYFPELCSRWRVEDVEIKAAPAFHDPPDYTNSICPSYSEWDSFCRKVGLYDLFFKEYEGFLSYHPGCMGITTEDLEVVFTALKNHKKSGEPGFCKKGCSGVCEKHDGALATLIWLEWWMRWAIKNCETPAVGNS